MKRAAVAALAAAALGAGLVAGAASGEPTQAQELFRERLLDSRGIARDVRTRLRKGGFVDRRITFADVTGEGRSDAVVLVHSGGSAGRIALFVFSAGDGEDLELVYRNQRLYRATARVRSGNVIYRVPAHEPGDDLCCPSAERETELRWDPRRERFRVVDRRSFEIE
ncbi:MAG: hypothetical protein WD844_15875 [Thermoleophilaceae bacterium]